MSYGSMALNKSFGREFQFGEIRQIISSEEESKAWCDFAIDIMFLFFIIVFLEFSINVGY